MTPPLSPPARLPRPRGVHYTAWTAPLRRSRPAKAVPVISFIRRIVKSWVSMILIGLLIISFAVWGTSDVLLGGASDTVVKAGSRQLSSQEFRREFDQYKAQTEERVGEPIPIDLAVERGLDRQVLEGLANRESLAEMFYRMGVRVSDSQVADQIKDIPVFFDRVSAEIRQQMDEFVASYLATVTSDPRAAFDLLTPEFQEASGGYDGYIGWWSQVQSAELASVDSNPSDRTVAYTVNYQMKTGRTSTQRVRLQLQREGDDYLIAGEA